VYMPSLKTGSSALATQLAAGYPIHVLATQRRQSVETPTQSRQVGLPHLLTVDATPLSAVSTRFAVGAFQSAGDAATQKLGSFSPKLAGCHEVLHTIKAFAAPTPNPYMAFADC